MKIAVFVLCLLLMLVCAPSAMAADVPITNAGAETPTTAGDEATGWDHNAWGTNAAAFSRPNGGAHGGTFSLKVDVSTFTNGDAKWLHAPVAVIGGKYYRFSHWYKSDADTAVAMYWQTAAQVTAEAAGQCDGDAQPPCGTWSNLEMGIEASPDWKQFESGIDMPESAVRAYFVHLIAHTGFLQTDDYKLEQLDSPPGFNRALVTLTFDDSTPNLYDYVIPELDKVGFKSTQYVVTGATGARDDNGVLYQWSAEQIADVHRRGHEIGSHTEFHPNLTMPGPKTECEGKDAANLPMYTAVPAGGCPTGQEQTTRAGSWLDPFGGSMLWMRPATIGAPTQELADTTLTQELGNAKAKLEANIKYGVPTLAYPFGAYDSKVVDEGKALGYKAARSVDDGYNARIGLNPFKIRVQNMQQAVCTNTTTREVTKADRTAGEDAPKCGAGQTMSPDVTTQQFEQWVKQANDNNYWLVLVYHPVDDLGVNPYGTSDKRFAEQMQAIKDAGIEVKTIRDALNEVMPQVGSWTRLPSPSEVEIPGDTPPPGPIPGPDPNPPTDHVVVPPPVGPPTARTADAVRPTIEIRSPTRRSYRRGRTVRADFKCSDNVHVVKCKGTVRKGARIDTRRRGRKKFAVIATDGAGNVRTVTITYRVR
jgi:peptidoglycan/xylan/chitin deacetylase (PgdA/CDA1 family)